MPLRLSLRLKPHTLGSREAYVRQSLTLLIGWGAGALHILHPGMCDPSTRRRLRPGETESLSVATTVSTMSPTVLRHRVKTAFLPCDDAL